MKFPKLRPKMSVWQYLALGYLLVILVGSALLSLPWASADGPHWYIDSLFTAVSATCVTGLVPFDTGTSWTLFGKIVILFMIQLGGIGFMTFVSTILMAVRKGLGQYERRAVIQSMGGGSSEGVKRLVRRIVLGTLFFELFGAGLLCIRFIPQHGVGNGIWYSIFHSISAFCNAGFDILGATEFAGAAGSLSYYIGDPLVSLTLCFLIFMGGLGFCVWQDVIDCRFRVKKYQSYTKIIIIAHFAILFIGTALFLLFEWNNPTYQGYNFWQKLLASFFNSTTARTAGFYTTEPSTLSSSGYLLMNILMFIGGCSGSTAGGMKVGTFIIIVMGMITVMRGRQDIHIGKRRVDSSLLGQSLAIFMAYLTLVLVSTLMIAAIEPAMGHTMANGDPITFQTVLFETISALNTVGLTSGGFTGVLSVWSKLIIIMLMYAGRVGILTLASALTKKKDAASVRRPIETFYVG